MSLMLNHLNVNVVTFEVKVINVETSLINLTHKRMHKNA
jgi:hypothetical protein